MFHVLKFGEQSFSDRYPAQPQFTKDKLNRGSIPMDRLKTVSTESSDLSEVKERFHFNQLTVIHSFSRVHITDLNCTTNNLLFQNQPQREK